MQDAKPSRVSPGSAVRLLVARARSEAPALTDCGVALVSAVLLIISFPDFELWPLAWIGLAPLLLVVARKPRPWPSFFLGWLFGTVFFYGSCYWLTYSMIHTAGISPWIAFPLLLPGAIVVGFFPAVFTLLLARACRRWGAAALFLSPLFWSALEWARLETTGQLWNAIGYSQAYYQTAIQSARWGGVYAVSFLIVLVNATLAYLFVQRNTRALTIATIVLLAACFVFTFSAAPSIRDLPASLILTRPEAVVIAVQPNVPMDLIRDPAATEALIARHISLSETALQEWERSGRLDNAGNMTADSDWAKDDSPSTRRAIPRLIVWPESPMNFAYGGDSELRRRLSAFAQANHTSLLLNSQELAPGGGFYNSAVLINEEGRLVAQYDKIRLLPFGEYVPLPQWLPGAGLIRGIVGEFTPGTSYPLMPVGSVRAGVFICIESAYPAIARRFTAEGADVLINISNDGYLGPTAVMRQHLANAIFRAVENGRPVLRVTNTGITAFIATSGVVGGATVGFKPDVRTWTISAARNEATFYARHGDLFVYACVLVSLLMFVLSFRRRAGQRARADAD